MGRYGLPLAWSNIYEECGNSSQTKRAWAKAVLTDAEKERQEGIQGNWQKESPFKQDLELVKRRSDLSFIMVVNVSSIQLRQVRELVGNATRKDSKKTAGSVYGQE